MPNYKGKDAVSTKQHVFGLSVSATGMSKDQERSTEIDLSELMRVIESNLTLITQGEEARKLRRNHDAIHYQFKKLF